MAQSAKVACDLLGHIEGHGFDFFVFGIFLTCKEIIKLRVSKS